MSINEVNSDQQEQQPVIQEAEVSETHGASSPLDEPGVAETAETSASETPEPEKDDHRTVPLQALREERYLRQELNRQLQEATNKLKEFEEWKSKSETSVAEQARKAEDEKELQRFNNEPFQVLYEKIKTLETQVSKPAEQKNDNKNNDISSFISGKYEEVKAALPDYDEAYSRWSETTFNKYMGMGFDQEDAARLYARDEMDIIQAAQKTGKNPFMMVYEAVKATPAQPQKPKPGIIESVKQAATAPRSLATTTGKSPSTQEKSIDDMNDKEFSEYFKKLTKDAISY